MLSLLLFTLYTNGCTSTNLSIKLLKFADNTTLIVLIHKSDELAYKQVVQQLASWCSANNLQLNTTKTVEMVVDFRKDNIVLPFWDRTSNGRMLHFQSVKRLNGGSAF